MISDFWSKLCRLHGSCAHEQKFVVCMLVASAISARVRQFFAWRLLCDFFAADGLRLLSTRWVPLTHAQEHANATMVMMWVWKVITSLLSFCVFDLQCVRIKWTDSCTRDCCVFFIWCVSREHHLRTFESLQPEQLCSSASGRVSHIQETSAIAGKRHKPKLGKRSY